MEGKFKEMVLRKVYDDSFGRNGWEGIAGVDTIDR